MFLVDYSASKLQKATLFPFCIQDGLARLNIRPYTDKEWDTLPHVFLTSEKEWDPSFLDHVFPDDEQWGDPDNIDPLTDRFDEFGDYRHRIIVQHMSYFLQIGRAHV